jgi:hypothetical protein
MKPGPFALMDPWRPGLVEYAPFNAAWNPNGGYYYARLSYKF